MGICPVCGYGLSEGARFCGGCGSTTPAVPAKAPAKDDATEEDLLEATRAVKDAATMAGYAFTQGGDDGPRLVPVDPVTTDGQSVHSAATAVDLHVGEAVRAAAMAAAFKRPGSATMVQFAAVDGAPKAASGGDLDGLHYENMSTAVATNPIQAYQEILSAEAAETAKPPEARPRIGAATMVGVPASVAQSLASVTAAPAPAPAPVDQVRKIQAQTLVGVAYERITPAAAPPPTAGPPVAIPPPAPPQEAPSLATQLPENSLAIANGRAPKPIPVKVANQAQTLLGVTATPEIRQAARERPMTLPPVAPAPAPFVAESLPPPPAVLAEPKKSGVPVAAVVGGLAALLLAVGGVGGFFLLRGGSPLTARATVDAKGHDVLEVTCEKCADGTTLALGTATATLASGKAQLAVPQPLFVGENPLTVKVDRPGFGRDEEIHLRVPLNFRVKADDGNLGDSTPSVDLQFAVLPNSVVTVDGVPVPIDAKGIGLYKLPFGPLAQGSSAKAETLEKAVKWAIVFPDGSKEGGTTKLGAQIVPLRADSPAPVQYLIGDQHLIVGGQTTPGAKLEVVSSGGKKSATADEKGLFEIDAGPQAADGPFSVTAARPASALRRIDGQIKHFKDAKSAVVAAESAAPLGYDGFVDGDAARGKWVALEGTLLEGKVSGRQRLALFDTKRGCAKGGCLVRVVIPEGASFGIGTKAKGYGTVVRSVTADGKTVPEVHIAWMGPVKP